MTASETITDANGVSRRDFLRAGGLTVVGLSGAARASSFAVIPSRRAILILMTGGVSQLETFDPKPEAHSSVRGPFKSIETAVPGIRFGESLPRLAQRADRFAVVRSLTHDAAPIHETGQQLLQTGQLSIGGIQFPNWSSLVAREVPGRHGIPSHVMLPQQVSDTGVCAYRGQQAGLLGPEWEPNIAAPELAEESESTRRMYGESEFGRQLLQQREDKRQRLASACLCGRDNVASEECGLNGTRLNRGWLFYPVARKIRLQKGRERKFRKKFHLRFGGD